MHIHMFIGKRFFLGAIALLFLLIAPVSVLADEAKTVYVTSTRVNFRTLPSTEAQIIETLNAGEEITILEKLDSGWSKVVRKEVQGYISSQYICEKSEYTAVELVEWSEVKNILKTYTPIKVYDIRTGITYQIQSFSNGLHADVETLTKDDTAKLLQTYNGKWKWDPRPVWVTINGRTIAASINGMPHGGGTIANNGLNGQICLHFKGSTTHNGNRSFAQWHQDVLMEAYNAR